MAKYNKNFARSGDGTELVFAPGEFDFGGVHYNASNNEKIYNEMGYLRYFRSEKPEREGFIYTPYYEEAENSLFQKWKEEEIVIVPEEDNEEYVLAAKILLGEVSE